MQRFKGQFPGLPGGHQEMSMELVGDGWSGILYKPEARVSSSTKQHN